MCFGSKKSSTAAPAPSPATTFQALPADTSNAEHREAVTKASTAEQTKPASSFGSELAGAS